MNLLIIIADDMSYSSMGFAGCELNTTPTIDKISSTSAFFENAHTNISLCQPARSILTTGLYPWNNGCTGFNAVRDHVETMVTIMKRCNYYCGSIGKANHLCPPSRYQFDYNVGINGCNRQNEPYMILNFCEEFFGKASQPFFLLVNSEHPHRKFPKSIFDPNKVIVPGFLEDSPVVRKEISEYYTGVLMCDYTVKLIIDFLKYKNLLDDLLIVFTTDHGMSFPYVKGNCYHFSTHIPLIFNHPKIAAKRIKHRVSSIDFLPTILDFMDIEHNCKFDGTSYLPIINGTESENENRLIYTCYEKNGWKIPRWMQTRAIYTDQFCYVRNYWYDGKLFVCEDGSSQDTPSFMELKRHRQDHHRYRCLEELYDMKNDKWAMNNLVGSVDCFDSRLLMDKMARSFGDHVNNWSIKMN